MIPDDYQAIIQRLEGELNEYILANQELARIGQVREDTIQALQENVRILKVLVRIGKRMANEAQSHLEALATVLHVLPDDLTEAQPVTIDDTMAAALDKATGETRPV